MSPKLLFFPKHNSKSKDFYEKRMMLGTIELLNQILLGTWISILSSNSGKLGTYHNFSFMILIRVIKTSMAMSFIIPLSLLMNYSRQLLHFIVSRNYWWCKFQLLLNKKSKQLCLSCHCNNIKGFHFTLFIIYSYDRT